MSTLIKSVRKSPLLWPLRKVIGAVREFNFKYTYEAYGFLVWVMQSIKGFRPHGNEQKRLLAVYDLSSQPFSIGDILIYQLASLVIREQYNLGLVDFALVYDPQRPASADPAFAHITPENALFHVASILPVAQVNPHHGSLFIFNSHRQLKQFIAAHVGEYYVWPSAWRFWKRIYNYYEVLNHLIHNHFQRHGSIPHLVLPTVSTRLGASFLWGACSAGSSGDGATAQEQKHLHQSECGTRMLAGFFPLL